MKNIYKLFLIAVVVSTVGCEAIEKLTGKKDKEGSGVVSRGTGLDIDPGQVGDPDFVEMDAPPGLVPIEAGSFTIGKVKDDVLRQWNNIPQTIQVASFYMDETEVTNLMWREYLGWLRGVFMNNSTGTGADPINKLIVLSAVPDTMVWRDELSRMEHYVRDYLRHPAYNEYPVVGINYYQAINYCKWRTDRVNQAILADNGYLDGWDKPQFNKNTYLYNPGLYGKGKQDTMGGSSQYARIQDGLFTTGDYRLPTEAEWEFAGRVNLENEKIDDYREYNNNRGNPVFSTNTRKKTNKGQGRQGDFISNIKRAKGDYSGIAGWKNDGFAATAPVTQFSPNDYGLYGMYGNVSEWTADVYRDIFDGQVSDFNTSRGNVYEKVKYTTKDGTITKQAEITQETLFDTLPDGKLIYKSLNGEIVYQQLDSIDFWLRDNVSRAYNINYNDGDKISQRTQNERRGSYNSPKDSIVFNDKGEKELVKDDSNYRTSYIDDKTRVIKGASWGDLAYWMDPAERRPKREYTSSAFIGFRCAMDRPPSSKIKNKRVGKF